MESNRIVAGVDASASSWDVLQWAVGEAHRWRAALQVIMVEQARRTTPERTDDSCLAQMVAEARRLEPAVRVTGTIGDGDAVHALCRAAHGARMIVVGRHDRAGFGHLRSAAWTSQQLAEESTVPVTVMRGDGSDQNTIVVGVDGSAGSEHALGVALEEARVDGCTVLAVFAYSHQHDPWLYGTYQPPPDPQLQHASAYAALASTVAPWREKFPRVTIKARATATPVVPFLTDLSGRARLVVVGAHGRDHADRQLGSVPAKLLHRAHCPLLIAP